VEPSENHSNNKRATYQEKTKLRTCRWQSYWALHTHCGKYWRKSTQRI